MAIVYIGVGSNLRDSKTNIKKAVEMIKENNILEEIQTSSLYLTEPIGKKEQPDFLNLVIKGQTEFSPFELLNWVLKIEDKLGRKRDNPVAIHLKVDTGMGRIGIWHEELEAFIKEALLFKGIKMEGLFTHFPCADCDPEFTHYQIKIFNHLVERLKPKYKKYYLEHREEKLLYQKEWKKNND